MLFYPFWKDENKFHNQDKKSLDDQEPTASVLFESPHQERVVLCLLSFSIWPNRNQKKKNKMVNIPKQRKTFCPSKKCKKHTLHKVSQYKVGKASLYAQGKSQSFLKTTKLCITKLRGNLDEFI